ILTANRGLHRGLADGIVVTPSHNPPEDGGFKYNPPNGGPADTDVTGWIQDEANRLLAEGSGRIRRTPFARAMSEPNVHHHRFVDAYVNDLPSVV
ncbi:phosphoglucomutase, alpha-D-glucose phosphate-specific, partial [Salmonella sp. NW387]